MMIRQNISTKQNQDTNRKWNTTPLRRMGFVLGLLIISQMLISKTFGQSTYYIDPSYTGNTRNGSMNTPYNSFSEFQWENGATYLVKSSTTLKLNNTINITGDRVTVGSYGSGSRPVIEANLPSGSRVITVRGDYVKVKDLDVRSLNETPETAAGCIIDMIGATNPVLDNCKTTGGTRGINASQTKGRATIINCHITDTWDDGMYNRINDTVIIENTLVERVNLKYHINPVQTYAGGDCVQFDYVTHFELKNVTLDKTYTGGKFCLIADHFETGFVENSQLIGAEMQHGVYIGIGEEFTFRYNTLSGCQYGIWNKSADLEIYYNVFKNTSLAAYYGDSQANSALYNNLFVNCKEGILSWNEKMKVNNNIFYQGSKHLNGNFSNINSSNNCYYPASAPSSDAGSLSADPLFVNAAAGDYRLNANSPCVDAGVGIGELTRDMQNVSIPVGSSSDIGPFEYNNGQPADNPVDDPADDPVDTNEPPVIKLNVPESVTAATPVELDASASSDPDGDNLSYAWIAPSGVQLSSPGSSKVSFLAPDTDTPQTLQFELSVTDGQETRKSSVEIDVLPFKPSIKKVKPTQAEASDYQDPNYPVNAIDDNISTRWSSQGDNKWLSLELEKPSTLSHLKIAYFGGSYRKGYFDLLASVDGENWDMILENASTCGLSEMYELFEVPSEKTYAEYKFIRVVGHENSENDWNSFAEFKIYGIPSEYDNSGSDSSSGSDNSGSDNNSDSTTGIEDQKPDGFNMYPNPSDGDLNIDFSEYNHKVVHSIRIVNLNGKVVFEQNPEFAAEKFRFSHNLLDGIYVLQVVFADNSQLTKKLIVRRP